MKDTPNSTRIPLSIFLDMLRGGEWTYNRIQSTYGVSYQQSRRYMHFLRDLVEIEGEKRDSQGEKVFFLADNAIHADPTKLVDIEQLDLFAGESD